LVTAVIAAAGSGERLGAGGPKAFVPLAGRPMVEWSIVAFRAADSVRSIVVACPPGHLDELDGQGLELVEGGASRSVSVANALAAVDSELVAIHDAARPLLDTALIEAIVATLAADPKADGAIAAAPVTDTVKLAAATVEAAGGEGAASGLPRAIEGTLDRGRLWAAQTPQVFHVEALRKALSSGSGIAATDEAMLVEAVGGRVLIHPAPSQNFKVTTPRDLRLAELLLAERH
jgi:2-C-methyl-D-erythritol 4-phosphate cytidylyltransferase